MVNLESLACGTPVITFDSGGSPECIDETCGRVVPCNDITALIKEIETICANSIFSSASCISRAQNFDKRKFGIAYVSLYKEMIGRV